MAFFFFVRGLVFIFCTDHPNILGRKAEEQAVSAGFIEVDSLSIKAFMTGQDPIVGWKDVLQNTILAV